MKLDKAHIFLCTLGIAFLCRDIQGMIPSDVVDAIEDSQMTLTLETYVANTSNMAAIDSDGNSMLLLAAQNSISYFFIQLFNENPSGFTTIINKANNTGLTPLRAALQNRNGKYEIIQIITFLLRHGAH